MEKDKKALHWLNCSHFIVDAYSGFLNPILPFLAAKLGITMAIAAFMISLSHLSSSISQPLFGFIADNCQKRFFIFWGILFAAIFLSFVGIASNIWTLAICIILGNLGVSFFHPQSTTFVSFFTNTKHTCTSLGFYIAMGTVGFATGPLISSSIVDHFGLESLPFASIIGIIFAFSMFLFIPKITSSPSNKNKNSLITAFKEMFKNKTMLILLMISILKSLIISSFCLTLPFYWKAEGFSATKIGTILFIFMLFASTANYTGGFSEKYLGAKKIFALSMVLIFPLTLAFYFLQNSHFILSLIPFFLIGYISFLAVPLNMAMAQNTMPQYHSMVAGFIGGFSWGVVGLLLPLISFLAEYIGILNVLLLMSLIPLFLSFYVKFLPDKY